MSASSTTLRLITLLFLLAGILLLRKPVFGQTNLTSPQIRAAHPSASQLIESATISAHRINIEVTKIWQSASNRSNPSRVSRPSPLPREIRLDTRNPRIALLARSKNSAP